MRKHPEHAAARAPLACHQSEPQGVESSVRPRPAARWHRAYATAAPRECRRGGTPRGQMCVLHITVGTGRRRPRPQLFQFKGRPGDGGTPPRRRWGRSGRCLAWRRAVWRRRRPRRHTRRRRRRGQGGGLRGVSIPPRGVQQGPRLRFQVRVFRLLRRLVARGLHRFRWVNGRWRGAGGSVGVRPCWDFLRSFLSGALWWVSG